MDTRSNISVMFSQNDTKFVRTQFDDGSIGYCAEWYKDGCYVSTEWCDTINEVYDCICDCFNRYGANDTNARFISETMWYDIDGSAFSKGKRVDDALSVFIGFERMGDVTTKKYRTMAEFEKDKFCYLYGGNC